MHTNLDMMVYKKEYFATSVYNGINIPVAIVIGDRDMISIEHGLEMYRLIKNSQYCVLPNTTHEVFDERATAGLGLKHIEKCKLNLRIISDRHQTLVQHN